jgi:hypothetical protein
MVGQLDVRGGHGRTAVTIEQFADQRGNPGLQASHRPIEHVPPHGPSPCAMESARRAGIGRLEDPVNPPPRVSIPTVNAVASLTIFASINITRRLYWTSPRPRTNIVLTLD